MRVSLPCRLLCSCWAPEAPLHYKVKRPETANPASPLPALPGFQSTEGTQPGAPSASGTTMVSEVERRVNRALGEGSHGEASTAAPA